jgi:hypothetical protein
MDSKINDAQNAVNRKLGGEKMNKITDETIEAINQELKDFEFYYIQHHEKSEPNYNPDEPYLAIKQNGEVILKSSLDGIDFDNETILAEDEKEILDLIYNYLPINKNDIVDLIERKNNV